MFFWNSLAFSMIQQMLAIWSLVPLPFLNITWTSGSSWFMYCWNLACRILSFASMWGKCNYALVWTLFGLAFLRDWNEKSDLLQSCGHCFFQICWHIECSTSQPFRFCFVFMMPCHSPRPQRLSVSVLCSRFLPSCSHLVWPLRPELCSICF